VSRSWGSVCVCVCVYAGLAGEVVVAHSDFERSVVKFRFKEVC